MIPSDAAPPDIAWFQREVADLRREIRELRAERRGESTSIGRGGITIKDDGSLVVLSADGTKKLIITDSFISMYTDLVNAPTKYFTWVSSELGVANISYQDSAFPGERGGRVELREDSLELSATPEGSWDTQQWISMSIHGGMAAIGSFGNFMDSRGAWMIDRVTGLSAGTTVVNYGVTYDTLPYPFVQVVAPAAVAATVTAYTTSGFTINVAAGPAAGTVSVLYWVVRPNVVTP